MAEIVYRSGLTAELRGRTNTAIQADTCGGILAPASAAIPSKMIGTCKWRTCVIMASYINYSHVLIVNQARDTGVNIYFPPPYNYTGLNNVVNVQCMCHCSIRVCPTSRSHIGLGTPIPVLILATSTVEWPVIAKGILLIVEKLR